MIKFISKCFTFKGIFSIKDHKKSVVIVLFLILVFVTSFPLNMAIYKNNGWKSLNTITIKWRTTTPDWLPDQLPNDWAISKNGLIIPGDQSKTYSYFSTDEDGKTNRLVLNPQENEPSSKDLEKMEKGEIIYTENNIIKCIEDGNTEITKYERTILLCKNKIIYYAEDDNLVKGDYSKVKKTINFTDLKFDETNGALTLLDTIDGCFNDLMIVSNLVINTFTQLLLNTLFVLAESLIFMLVRVKYQRITNFSQNINIVVASMVIPSIICFIAGVFNIIEMSSFTVVLFQLLSPLIAIGAIYKGSNIKDPSIKYTA